MKNLSAKRASEHTLSAKVAILNSIILQNSVSQNLTTFQCLTAIRKGIIESPDMELLALRSRRSVLFFVGLLTSFKWH